MSLDMSKTHPSQGRRSARAVYSVPRVNLCPTRSSQSAARKRLQIGLGAATLVVVGALVGGYLVSAASVDLARGRRWRPSSSAPTPCATEETQYCEVPRVLAQVDAAQNARSTAMVTDVLWYRPAERAGRGVPERVWLRDITVSLGRARDAAAPMPRSSASRPASAR